MRCRVRLVMARELSASLLEDGGKDGSEAKGEVRSRFVEHEPLRRRTCLGKLYFRQMAQAFRIPIPDVLLQPWTGRERSGGLVAAAHSLQLSANTTATVRLHSTLRSAETRHVFMVLSRQVEAVTLLLRKRYSRGTKGYRALVGED